MSEIDKDNKNFEFIKEQVIENKRRKWKKKLFPLVMTVSLAILFGVIAAATFVLAAPKLYKFLSGDLETKTPVDFPTISPEAEAENTANGTTVTGNEGIENTTNQPTESSQTVTNTVIQKLDVSVEDYVAMYDKINEMVNKVDKSIVTITSTFPVEDWFGASEKTVNTTGVIVASNTSDYLILVSLDRVKGADSIRVKFSDTSYVDVALQDYETELNIGLLALKIMDIPDLHVDGLEVADLGESYGVSVGNPVIAIGNPNGHINSMDVGIVTSKGSCACITDNRLDLFNTNMVANDNSDGIILNFDGEIVGLITRTLKEDLNDDLSTVIGISRIKSIIIQMGIQESRIYFGVKADDMSEDAKKQKSVSSGIYINEVLADSPAFKAGLRDGDIILSIDDQTVLSTSNFYNIISAYKPGDKITVSTKRISGNTEKEIEVEVVLTEKAQ
ncbi:MAG: hypothetical protein K0S04_228 [Herbinix sp.]|jgi:S1-C subfamily serine protease|nr:hypothetical protein [Herbinix sp.]